MKKNVKKIISLMLSTIMCCVTFTFNVSSDEYSELDTINSCTEKLDRFNEKYGTMFALDENNDETLSFYSQMTDEEFEEYFLDVKRNYEDWLEANNDIENNRVMEKNFNNISNEVKADQNENETYRISPTVTETQRCYYTASYNQNSLNIEASVNYSAGWGQYINVDNYSSTFYEYPAYIANSCMPSIVSYSGYCVARCVFTSKLYVSKGIYITNASGGSQHYLTCDFVAGGGDVYMYASI